MSNADALIFGSPIYFMELTGVMHSCLERFYFPYVTYSAEQQTFFKRKLPIAFIYTMNVTQDWLQKMPIANRFAEVTKELFGVEPEIVCAYNTWQYPDYEKFEHGIFSVEQKKHHREENFPKELATAKQLGISLVQKVNQINNQ
ncbi:MAG: flavodoxin family protein [Selenomonadaceae bacterium]|nr:flavodoxin family protein [Selenomonadaceae bacterium]